MYYLLGISTALAFLFAFNFFFSLLAALLWRVGARFFENKSAQQRAAIIFAFRVLPLAFAFILVAAFLIPSYLLYEPGQPKEVYTLKLAAATLIALGAIGWAARRFFSGWRATRRLAASWLKQAEAIEIADVSFPVYRIVHPFPVIAVVGVFRPRMFVAGQVFELLDEAELRAAIWHEGGHLAARDNLKSVVLRVCKDSLLFAPFNRRLERAWTENAEAAADEYAATRGNAQTALDLAGALVKIARIVPPRGAQSLMPAGAFLIEQQNADVTGRVCRLLRQTENKIAFAERRPNKLNISPWTYLAGFCGLIILPATSRAFQHKIHLAYESVVSVLQ